MTTSTDTAHIVFPQVGDGSFIEADPRIHREELQLAFRNKALPLEALRYDVTPTGMHYTLIHYDILAVDPVKWRLDLGGSAIKRTSLTLDDLQSRETQSLTITMECAGDGRALTQPRGISQPWLHGAIGTAEWTGTQLAPLLRELATPEFADLAGNPSADVVFTGLDEGYEGGIRQRYQRGLPLSAALQEDVLLAWAMNGAPLEPQHGFPLRVVVPGWFGMAHVKWLSSIEIMPTPFDGYQNTTAYRYSDAREEAGRPVDRMRVRSLMIPPGVPDFLTRTRVVDPGAVEISGRAWSGNGTIDRVEFSDDEGRTWIDADVEKPLRVARWQGWNYRWQAEPGSHVLCCRAYDSAGEVQPVEQYWTARGMGNNAVQRVPVLVRPAET